MDTFALIATERMRLADALDELTPDQWAAPSLCEGWSVHVVAAHLNAPWAVSTQTVLWSMTRSFSLDGGFDQIARHLAEHLDPSECVAGLREHAGSTFTPPGSGPEAPLTDVLVHGADMLRPLGRSVDPAPEALATALAWLAGGRAKRFVPRRRVRGLVVAATDVDCAAGPGPAEVRGPALALCGALCGRPSWLDELSGDGVATLRARI